MMAAVLFSSQILMGQNNRCESGDMITAVRVSNEIPLNAQHPGADPDRWSVGSPGRPGA